MDRFWMKNWPAGVPTELVYRLGPKPLFEYLRQNAREMPNRPAYIYYGKTITWSDLDLFSDRFAGFLHSLGIGKGDKVMLFMQNCPQYLVAHHGTQKLGAIVVPANPMFKEMELEYEANDVGASVIVTTDDLYPTLEKVRDKTPLREVVVTNYRDLASDDSPLRYPEELQKKQEDYPRTRKLMDILDNPSSEFPEPKIDIWEDVAMIVYTSGTTGRPKGAMLTYGNALFKVASASTFNRIGKEDTLLSVMPLCHIAGNVLGVGMPVYSGATTVLLTRFEPDVLLQAIDRYRCTWLYGVTPMLIAMMNHPEAKTFDLRSLRQTNCTSFGIALTEEIADRWRSFVGGAPVVESGYGLSETHTCDVFMPPDKIKFGPTGSLPLTRTSGSLIPIPERKNRLVNRGRSLFEIPGFSRGI